MARPRLIYSDRFAYHVTNRSNNRDWFYLPISEVWEIFQRYLLEAQIRYGVELHAFVLMSNHYHLILSTPQKNLDAFMRYLQTEVAREVQRRTGRTNHIFGTRYKWSLLEGAVALAYAIKYVLRNPVRAGICTRVEEYPYSSFYELMRFHCGIPITEGLSPHWRLIPRPLNDRLEWLNRATKKEQEALIGKAIRRTSFQFSKGNDVRLLLENLKESYGIESSPATFSAEK